MLEINLFVFFKYWNFDSFCSFHAMALVPTTSNVTAKINYWQDAKRKNPGVKKPPDVVIIGVLLYFVLFKLFKSRLWFFFKIDSMSRLSFTRTMSHTRKVLEGLGAVEMFGYTKGQGPTTSWQLWCISEFILVLFLEEWKSSLSTLMFPVGENTIPNVMAALGGYSDAEMRDSCFLSDQMAQDGCPYLWDRFSGANYLTALIEDAPLLAIFNYLKTGFVQQPTDFYFRPFMLAVHQHEPIPVKHPPFDQS